MQLSFFVHQYQLITFSKSVVNSFNVFFFISIFLFFSGSGSAPSTLDVDKLMRKLEEDDKALRELEKLEVERLNINTLNNINSISSVPVSSSIDIDTCSSQAATTTVSSLANSQVTTTSSIGSTITATTLSSSMPILNDCQSYDRLAQLNSRQGGGGSGGGGGGGGGSSISSKELDKLMRKLEQDNKILAELDQKVKKITSNNMVTSSSDILSSSLPALTSNFSGLHSTTHTQFLSGLYISTFGQYLYPIYFKTFII